MVSLVLLTLLWAVNCASLLDGCWFDHRSKATIRIVDRGTFEGGVFATSENEPWSPAVGYVDFDGRTVAFSMGLKNTVALYDGGLDRLRFTNGMVWEKRPGRCTVPGRWFEPPQIGGCWKGTNTDWFMAVIQTGHSVLLQSSWLEERTPAVGEVDNGGQLVFLDGSSATLGGSDRVMSFMNDTWHRLSDFLGGGCGEITTGQTRPANAPSTVKGGVELAGCWKDVAEAGEIVITALGDWLVYVASPHPWSPAVGFIDGPNLVFSLGLAHVEAQYDMQDGSLRFIDGGMWKPQPCSGPNVTLPTPHTVADSGARTVEGCWWDGKHTTAVVQQGATVAMRSEGQWWSPAVGDIDSTGRVVFRYGLRYITMQLSDDGMQLVASDGMTWRKTATTLSVACGLVPTSPPSSSTPTLIVPVTPSATHPVTPSATLPTATHPVTPSATLSATLPTATHPVTPSATHPVTPSATHPVTPSATLPVTPPAVRGIEWVDGNLAVLSDNMLSLYTAGDDPQQVGAVSFDGEKMTSMAVAWGSKVFVTGAQRTVVVEVNDLFHPVVRGAYMVPLGEAVCFHDDTIYTVASDGKLYAIPGYTPYGTSVNPSGQVEPWVLHSIAVGENLYVGSGHQLLTYQHVKGNGTLQHASSTDVYSRGMGSIMTLLLKHGKLYIGGTDRVVVMSVLTPSPSPVFLGEVRTGGPVLEVKVMWPWLYAVVEGEGATVYDVSDLNHTMVTETIPNATAVVVSLQAVYAVYGGLPRALGPPPTLITASPFVDRTLHRQATVAHGVNPAGLALLVCAGLVWLLPVALVKIARPRWRQRRDSRYSLQDDEDDDEDFDRLHLDSTASHEMTEVTPSMQYSSYGDPARR